MKNIIYTCKYYCELCKEDQLVNLYGDHTSAFTSQEEPELIEWARHYHWIDHHRVCAKCGHLVQSGELEVAVNDGSITIHRDYTDHYKNVSPGDHLGHLLIVHKYCIAGKNTNV